MAGSKVNGPYGSSRPSCQPSSWVQRKVIMWSVNLTPNAGAASNWSRSAARTG